MYFNKNIFLGLLWFSFFSLFAQEPTGWIKLESPTNETLRRLYFVNENCGWAVSLGGQIISTTDAGNTWNIQNSTVTTPVVDIFFINPNRGWALTYPAEPPFGTSILKTTNGGLEWIKDSVFFENEIFTTILFLDENTGFVGGNGIKKTIDGGLTWLNSFIEPGGVSTLPINKFSFYSNTFGYACGGRVDVAGVVWRTTDGGNNWSSIGLSPDQIYDVYVIDSLNAVSLSGDPELLYPIAVIKTSDAGITWSFTDLSFFGISYAIDFLDDKEGWSVAGFKFLNSTDGGETWIEQFIFDSTIVYDLQFVDKYTGFACGENGVLIKYTSSKKYLPLKPTFELGQNHPNPFSESTMFYIYSAMPELTISERAQVKLYDILGNELLTLVDQDFLSGMYEFTFNPSLSGKHLSSGIYFLTLISGESLVTKKIVYLK